MTVTVLTIQPPYAPTAGTYGSSFGSLTVLFMSFFNAAFGATRLELAMDIGPSMLKKTGGSSFKLIWGML